MYKITITQTNGADTPPVDRYIQTVDELDLPALIKAINQKPRKRRTKAEMVKADPTIRSRDLT